MQKLISDEQLFEMFYKAFLETCKGDERLATCHAEMAVVIYKDGRRRVSESI